MMGDGNISIKAMATAGIPTPTPPPPDGGGAGGGLMAHELMVMVVVARGTSGTFFACLVLLAGMAGSREWRMAKGRPAGRRAGKGGKQAKMAGSRVWRTLFGD